MRHVQEGLLCLAKGLMRLRDTDDISISLISMSLCRPTKPTVLVTKVQPPIKCRMTKPPRTVLISGIPLCFAYGENSVTSRLADAAKDIYSSLALRVHNQLLKTYREQHKEDILHDPLPSHRPNAK